MAQLSFCRIMKKLQIFLAMVALIVPQLLLAQISISQSGTKPTKVMRQDSIEQIDAGHDYYSDARYRAERAAIRKERNYLEIGASVLGSLTTHNDPWIEVSGGDNSIAMTGAFLLRHTFTKGKFSVETRVDAKLGVNRMKVETTTEAGETTSDNIWFKNQDEFSLSTAPSFKMSENWSYGSIIKFRSQFANGYISRTQQGEDQRKSTFLAPAYFDISFGITFTNPSQKFPIKVNVSPIALSSVYVTNEQVRLNVWDGKPGWQVYGLSGPDAESKYEGGSSVQLDFDRTFGKNGFLRYTTTMSSFFGWITNIGMKNKYTDYGKYVAAIDEWNSTGEGDLSKKPNLVIHPTLRWQNTIDIKATKFLTTRLNFLLTYNRAENVDVRTQTILSVGLAYTFKNK